MFCPFLRCFIRFNEEFILNWSNIYIFNFVLIILISELIKVPIFFHLCLLLILLTVSFHLNVFFVLCLNVLSQFKTIVLKVTSLLMDLFLWPNYVILWFKVILYNFGLHWNQFIYFLAAWYLLLISILSIIFEFKLRYRFTRRILAFFDWVWLIYKLFI